MMIHHVSFSVEAPQEVAQGLAEILAGHALSAPCPPFPTGTWFVVVGDAQGTLIELMPWGMVLDPTEGIRADPQPSRRTASHILISTPLDSATVMKIADDKGWGAQTVNAGLFKFIKIWIADTLPIEVLPPEYQAEYCACFGASGLPVLDKTLRDLEQKLKALKKP